MHKCTWIDFTKKREEALSNSLVTGVTHSPILKGNLFFFHRKVKKKKQEQNFLQSPNEPSDSQL